MKIKHKIKQLLNKIIIARKKCVQTNQVIIACLFIKILSKFSKQQKYLQCAALKQETTEFKDKWQKTRPMH